MTEKPTREIIYSAYGRRDDAYVEDSIRYDFIILPGEAVPAYLRKRLESNIGAVDPLGKRVRVTFTGDPPCGYCMTGGCYCTPAYELSLNIAATILSGQIETRPYLLIFDRFIDENPHIGYWNITTADWEAWKKENHHRDITSIEGFVQKTEGVSAHHESSSQHPWSIAPNGRDISETNWFTVVDGDDFKKQPKMTCCRRRRCARNIRVTLSKPPQLRNQIINGKCYRRSRDLWFPIFEASLSSEREFIGMLSSENMSDALLNGFLQNAITTKKSSFNEY
jgi:hypothetical protein